MPLKGDAKKVMESMKDQYGDEKAEEVFYATANKQDRRPETWEKKSCFVPGKVASADANRASFRFETWLQTLERAWRGRDATIVDHRIRMPYGHDLEVGE